jgi:hypothetical protein
MENKGARSYLNVEPLAIGKFFRIKESIENKQFGCGIFIDIRKAFDTVNTKILLAKLEHYGIRGISLDWFNSYILNIIRKEMIIRFQGEFHEKTEENTDKKIANLFLGKVILHLLHHS